MVYGKNPVLSLLEGDGGCIKLFILKGRKDPFRDKVLRLCQTKGIPFQELDPEALDRIAGSSVHQGFVARVSPVKVLSMEDLINMVVSLDAAKPLNILVLDHVEDPHNLGAMIRTAEAAGIFAVLIPSRRGALPTGTVVKCSAGAALRMPMVMIGNVSQAIRDIKDRLGLWVIGIEANGERSIFEAAMPRRIALVVGSEGKGLGRVVASSCDEVLRIPMLGRTGSLNVSVAAALAMYEWFRGLDF
ncbi:MAG: 23S rRNA (guanosine(2251)-2'-O)-methyltransferase RlmB [Thermanaerothrix sp.]|nr:23S rRNA (guanosine(2251)-2'-O)-methyltransferase RlmB [Thermanaerothrix sp.]